MHRNPPPLVLVPGHMGTAVDWRFQQQAFAAVRPVLVPERHFTQGSLRAMAEDIAARLPARFDLVGWSMGGYLCFELYRQLGERVRRLVLLHTSARPESDAARLRRQALLARVRAAGFAAAMREELLAMLVHPGRFDAALLEALLAERVRLGPEVLLSQIGALGTRRDARAQLSSISCETLVIAGDADTILPLEHATEMAAALPHASLEVLVGAGHCSPYEEPQRCNELLRAFLG